MGASQVQVVSLGAGGFEVVETRPVVLTSVLVTERTGAAAAKVVLTDADGAMTYLQFGVLAGQSAAWADRVAVGSGLAVMSLAGSVAVCVAYEYRLKIEDGRWKIAHYGLKVHRLKVAGWRLAGF